MSALGTVQLLIISGLAFLVLASLAVSAAVPLVVSRTSSWSPARRHRLLVAIGIAPVWLTLGAQFSVLLPTLLSPVWPALDHCLYHDDGHPHLCFTHLAAHQGHWLGWVLIAAVCLALATRLGLDLKRVVTASGLVRRLIASAQANPALGAWVVPTAAVWCLSVGVFRPRVVLTEGLIATIDPGEIGVILAHEDAHRRRRDTLVRLILRLFTLSLLPGPRRYLLTSLELTSEQACDEEAAAQVGDRVQVAATIVAMERRMSQTLTTRFAPLVAGFGSSSVVERVESMLAPPRHNAPGLSTASGFSIALVVAMIASYEHMHHITESVLALLNH